MTAARLVTITLARAWDPAEPEPPAERISFAVVLDAARLPDEQAWLDDPAPWPATRERPGAPPEAGDVAHDEDGWQLRFHAGRPDQPDLPAHRLCHLEGGLRPGEVITLSHPDGTATTWRVVGVTAPEPG